MAIDDPLKKTLDQQRDAGIDAFDAALKVVGLFDPVAGLLSVVRGVFQQDAVIQRQQVCLDAVVTAHREESERVSGLEKTVQEIRRDLDILAQRLEFRRALVTAVTLSAFAADDQRAFTLGGIVGRQTAQQSVEWEECEAFLQDVARVTEADLRVLEILADVQGDLANRGHMPLLPNEYRSRLSLLLVRADRSFPREDFYSRCARLSGFGLAMEVPRVNTAVGPSDHCFRVTSRGLQLLVLLGRRSL
jgi:hypothetical protein